MDFLLFKPHSENGNTQWYSFLAHSYPNLTWIDPLCTFVFSLIVLVTTFHIAKDIVLVISEAAPSSIDVNKVTHDLNRVRQVKSIHHLRIWSLTSERIAAIVHVVVPDEFAITKVQKDIRLVLEKAGVTEPSIQVEIEGINVCQC